jgi:hypothetical protein
MAEAGQGTQTPMLARIDLLSTRNPTTRRRHRKFRLSAMTGAQKGKALGDLMSRATVPLLSNLRQNQAENLLTTSS